MANAAHNIYPAQYDKSAANDSGAPTSRNSNVIDLTQRRKGQAANTTRSKQRGPYAAAEQSTTVPTDDAEFLLQRYNMDFRPNYAQLEAANQNQPASTKAPTVVANAPSTNYQVPSYAQPAAHPTPYTTKPRPRKAANQKKRIRKKGKGLAKGTVKNLTTIILSMAFVGIFAKAQLWFAVLTVIVFGAMGLVSGSFSDPIPILGNITGAMLAGMFLIFWFLSAALGWIMIAGLLSLMSIKRYHPYAGSNILSLVGMLIVSTLPFLNMFTIFMAALWVMSVMRRKVKRV